MIWMAAILLQADLEASMKGGSEPREFAVKEGGARHLRLRGDYKGPITLSGDEGVLYLYSMNELAGEFHFYPVLQPGKYQFQIEDREGTCHLLLESYSSKISEPEIEQAKAAIDKGVGWLLKIPKNRAGDPESVAAEGLALAAISEGRDAKSRREAIDRDFVEWMEKRLEKVEEGSWQGREVFRLSSSTYAHAMAAIGLAEAVGAGSDKARALVERASDYLLASQQTARKCKAWKGPVDSNHEKFGSWRYDPDQVDGDLSVMGWCVVALLAADASGIRRPGMRDSMEDATAGLARYLGANGFGYEGPGAESDVLNSVGTLTSLLLGEDSSGVRTAMAHLDRHLPAATQVDTGDTCVFYTLYYATRANYLRGGPTWDLWRSVALRQLLRRQRADGSWEAFGHESEAGPRWSTAIAIMVLRLCLNDAPKYLKTEVRGF